jgi:hypothetical protein
MVSYVMISAACLNAGHYSVPKSLLEQLWPWIWLLGPPVTLIYGTAYWWVYAIGSVAVIGLVFTAQRNWDRRPAVTVVCIALAIAVWCVSGILVYAPTI